MKYIVKWADDSFPFEDPYFNGETAGWGWTGKQKDAKRYATKAEAEAGIGARRSCSRDQVKIVRLKPKAKPAIVNPPEFKVGDVVTWGTCETAHTVTQVLPNGLEVKTRMQSDYYVPFHRSGLRHDDRSPEC